LKMCWIYVGDTLEDFPTVEKAAITILAKLDKLMREKSL